MPLKNRALIAIAGAGKTYGICKEIIELAKTQHKRVLVVTYTNRGADSVNIEYCKQNLGVLDEYVEIETWYQFLLHELILPYQRSVVCAENRIRSIDFLHTYGYVNYNRRGTPEHYLTRNDDVFNNAASELAVDCNTATNGKVIRRLESIYSHIYFDEVQDLAGEDLSVLRLLFSSTISVVCVGDYRQATYKTHNSKKNKKISGENIEVYFKQLDAVGVLTLEYNLKSRRYNDQICKFSNLIYSECDCPGETVMQETTGHDGVFLIRRENVELYCRTYTPVILRYDAKEKADNRPSYNFGQCKGLTFDRVLIYCNEPLRKFVRNRTKLSAPSKYYVAVTRPRYSLAFVVDELWEDECTKRVDIECGEHTISVAKVCQ